MPINTIHIFYINRYLNVRPWPAQTNRITLVISDYRNTQWSYHGFGSNTKTLEVPRGAYDDDNGRLVSRKIHLVDIFDPRVLSTIKIFLNT